jgi:hypothetical protein
MDCIDRVRCGLYYPTQYSAATVILTKLHNSHHHKHIQKPFLSSTLRLQLSCIEMASTNGFLQARVKSVLSGDTLIMTRVENPKQERTLSLAYVSAPRLKRDGDEVSAIITDNITT